MAGKRSKPLVEEFFEGISGRVLEDYRQVVRDLIKGHAGVYALYKGNRLYYVGLASNMMSRVNHHLKDRHASRWDYFSVYLTATNEHIRPLEALVLRIAKPAGNKVQGRLAKARDLYRMLNREMSEQDKDSRAMILGERGVRTRRRRKTHHVRGTRSLAGLIPRRIRLVGTYKNREYAASLRKDGQISYAGKLYDSPTAAAKQIVHCPVSGWKFWHFRKGRDNWVPLAELRR